MSDLSTLHVGGASPYDVVVGTGLLGELPGAVWLRAIRCSDLSSETQGTPSALSECEATGAVIFENCAD